MRRSYRPSSHAPRRGQALLLAVLIMIFAALLSASFIAVVSSNLNQTARQTDKDRAVASARAGLFYINQQLTYSGEGDRWRPTLVSPIPAAGTPQYSLYYSAFDQAQGWAGSFAKFPDPTSPQGAGPVFLAKVERIPYGLALTHPDFSRSGSLKITVIGLSSEDPTAYETIIRYKGGFQQAPIAQTMRVVSNWDFRNGVVPVTRTAPTVTASPFNIDATGARVLSLNAASTRGTFPEAPFDIVIGDPTTNQGARGATVIARGVNAAGDPTFTLASSTSTGVAIPLPNPPIVANERVELAATLGAPVNIDYNNNNALDAGETVQFKIADANVSGTRVNGGLWWAVQQGQTTVDALRSFKNAVRLSANQATAGPVAPAVMQASGVVATNSVLPPTVGAAPVQVKQVTATPTATTTLFDSRNDAFPAIGSSGFPSTRTEQDQLVSDGWNRLKGVAVAGNPITNTGSTTTAIRSVANFRPPALDSRQNLERYRGLTRFSKAATPLDNSPATASLYGAGKGIYIDNIQDKEKIYDATLTPPRLREMTQAEFVRMLLSRTVAGAPPTNYMRTDAPLLPDNAEASLEQQHLRGWVGPDEFRGRGVEIELGNDPSFVNTNISSPLHNPSGAFLAITRDSRDDGPANAIGPVANKAWRTSAGALQPGVYRRRVAWPQNGVVLAEGNVRMRGTAINPPRSLTVVSLNNLYIEDSLQILPPPTLPAGYKNRKVLLLARKNVVMNPTRVLGRPDAQTTVTTGQTVTAGPNATLTVANGLAFKRGDFIQVAVQNAQDATVPAGTERVLAQGYITSDPTNTQITFTATLGGAVPDGTPVRTPTSVVRTGPTTPVRTIPFTSVASGTDVLQRRLNLPNPLPATLLPANLRLAFNHQANRVSAFTAGVTGDITSPVLFSNKGVFIAPPATTAPFLNHAATVVAQGDKKIRGQYTQPPPGGQDDFPGPVPTNPSAPATPTTEAEARDTDRNIAAISAAMNATAHPNPGPPPTTWSYNTSIPASGTAYSTLPFFYLAGVGNRLDFPFVTTPVPEERRPDIRTTPYEVPLATSISAFANGAQTTLSNERWNATVTPNRYDRTNQFGFSPTYTDAGDPNEDVLTGDQSFYQTDPIRSTVDSRQLGAGLTAGSNSLFLRQSEGLLALPVTTPPRSYPDYLLQGLKLENVALAASSDT
ncbi:MAG: hypothetical protein KY445_09735, partial [Armatimonadetes bacterium]|nr:hypothetical protein [Armatimonadota bacterium]